MYLNRNACLLCEDVTFQIVVPTSRFEFVWGFNDKDIATCNLVLVIARCCIRCGELCVLLCAKFQTNSETLN